MHVSKLFSNILSIEVFFATSLLGDNPVHDFNPHFAHKPSCNAVVSEKPMSGFLFFEMISKSSKSKSKSSNYNLTPTLNQFGNDLSKIAKEGKLDPVIGRKNEIERIIQILSRRTKNNPCLIGEPGVGKTKAVLEFCKKYNFNTLYIETAEKFEDSKLYSFLKTHAQYRCYHIIVAQILP